MKKEALKHFKKNDPVLYAYALKVGELEPIKKIIDKWSPYKTTASWR